MNLRWHIKEYKYSTYNSRFGMYEHHTTIADPVLQAMVGDTWFDIPTYQEIVDTRVTDDEFSSPPIFSNNA